jgi:hypothetical protein
MRQRLVLLTAIAVAGCMLVVTGVAAGATEVEHFTDGPFPDEVCGVTGTTTVHGTSVTRDLASGGLFVSGTFWAVFTADNGKSITTFAGGPSKSVAGPVIDEAAGTVTLVVTFVGLPEKVSITHGPTLLRDAGIVTLGRSRRAVRRLHLTKPVRPARSASRPAQRLRGLLQRR